MPTRRNGPGLRARPATYGGVFMVTLTVLMYEITLTVLMYEITLTRIFSVTMWFHFAFVAISVSLFGLTAGALLVHLVPHWFGHDQVRRQMWRFGLAYAVSIAAAFVAQLAVPFKVELSAAGIVSLVWTPLVIAVPFTFAGVVVALALTRFPRQVNRVYAVDLVGAGAGALVLLVAFDHLDGPSVVIFIAALAALGALLFALDAAESQGRWLAGVAAAVLLIGAVGNDSLADRGQGFVRILWGKDGRPDHELANGLRLYDRWNAFSRVTVDGIPGRQGPPSGNGMSPELPDHFRTEELNLLIDGTAGTAIIGWDGDPDKLGFLRYDVSNLAYHVLEGDGFDRAAVVGVGGGRDVLSALEFGADHIDGIDINGTIFELVNEDLGDFTGHLDRDPRVNFVTDEARSFLTRSDERYDIIQISLIDTWAATSSGAFALSENTLYTTEAWDTFLDRLQPGGILSVTRWFAQGAEQPWETIRTAVLAAEVLHQRGVDNPRDHILIYQGPPRTFGTDTVSVANVMVSAEPFAPEVRQQLGDVAGEMGFAPVLTADQSPDPRFAQIAAPGGPGPAVDQFTADVSAPDDDRPFFFQMADWRTLLAGEGFSDAQVFRPVATLAGLAFAVLLIAAVAIGGPLLHMGRRIDSHRRRVPHYLYFAAIGLGFMFVEITQLIRLSTFLGHPTFALAVVLFTVLLFSGLGSMLVERVVDLRRPRSLLWPLGALAVVLLVTGLLTPSIIADQAGSTTPVRIAVAVALLVPMSLLMGMPLAIGMRAASTERDAPTAFLWGINGAMSVVATVFATAVALVAGIAATLLVGWVAYLVAGSCLFVVVRRLLATGPEVEADVEAEADGDASDADAAGGPPATNGDDADDGGDRHPPAQLEPTGG